MWWINILNENVFSSEEQNINETSDQVKRDDLEESDTWNKRDVHGKIYLARLRTQIMDYNVNI